MSVQLQCAKCGKAFVVDRATAGKRILCTACGAVIRFPRALAAERHQKEMAAPPAPELQTPIAANPVSRSKETAAISGAAGSRPRLAAISILLSGFAILLATGVVFFG